MSTSRWIRRAGLMCALMIAVFSGFAFGDDEVRGRGNADVEYVRAVERADGSWTFSVTVRHPDTGWSDYADGWDVVLPDSTVLLPRGDAAFTRVLFHPHVDEQPFTRSQSGIRIPETVRRVTVRAHDSVDGFGGAEVDIDFDVASTDLYELVFYDE